MATGLININAVQRFPLAGGDLGTAQTIARIRRLVEQGKRSIAVNRLAISIVWNTPNFSQTEKARAIFDWVGANTRFVSMVVGAQTLRTADEILRVRAGDCANLNAVLIPSLLETIGIRARLVTIAHDPEDPRDFTHVYAEAFVDGQWVPMDVARPGAQFGRAPEQFFRMRIWALNSSAFEEVKRLSGYLLERRGRGLGVDWGSIINSASAGTANIIAATRAAPANIVASSTPYPVSAAAVPGGAASVQGYGVQAMATGIPSWVWLLVGGAVVVVMLRK